MMDLHYLDQSLPSLWWTLSSRSKGGYNGVLVVIQSLAWRMYIETTVFQHNE